MFLRETYAAVADTFAEPYIRIRGDEVPDEAWNQCGACATLDAPYQHTMRWMTETIVALGKRPVAWDEAASLDLPGETIIINWRRPEDAAAALQRGYDIVLAPERKAEYLDHQHWDSPEEPGRLGVCTVADSAGFSPSSYLDQGSGTSLGGQANIWTEEITVRRSLEYMAYVRLAVIADGLWLGRSATETTGWEQRVDRLRQRLFARVPVSILGCSGGQSAPPKKHISPD